jgi:hypothetical protein
VPAGIANTAFGLLHCGKKTSIFAQSSGYARATTQCAALCNEIAPRHHVRCAARDRACAKLFRLDENTHDTRVFRDSHATPLETKRTLCSTRARARKPSGRSVNHVNLLVKKISADKRRKSASSIESDGNRANRRK